MVTVRWAPGHKGVPGNERTDTLAKRGVGDLDKGTWRSRLSIDCASMTFLKRKAAERRTKETADWIRPRVARSRACIAPRKFELRPEPWHPPKALASRYYQLMSGHALIGPYMKEKLKKSDSDECWCVTPANDRPRAPLQGVSPIGDEDLRSLAGRSESSGVAGAGV
jgi:hypothetical protein